MKRSMKFTRGSIALASAATLVVLASPARAVQPVPAGVVPKSAPAGTIGFNVTITGAAFAQGSKVGFANPAIRVERVSYQSPSHLSATIDIAPGTAPGTSDVTVTSGGETGTCAACFAITAGPTITSVTPNKLRQGESASVTIEGTNLNGLSSIAFSGSRVTVDYTAAPGNGNRVAHNTPAVNDTIVARVTVDAIAAATARNVTVTSSDGGRGVCLACFTVLGGVPKVSSAKPNTRGQGALNQTIAIFGRNFATGAAVTFSGVNISAGTPTIVSPSKLLVSVNVGDNANPGAHDITVTNSDSSTSTCTACFTVTVGPKVGATAPATAPQGVSAKDITINGANFVSGSKASFGPDITVRRTLYVSATTVTATVSVAPGAETVSHQVTVTNPDAGSGSCAACFRVTPGPSISSITPDKMARASTGDITIQGTNLAGPVTVAFTGGGIKVNRVTPAGAGNLVANITVDQAALISTRSIVVTATADGGRAVCACFAVLGPPPIPTGARPDSASQGASGFKVQISGRNFQPEALVSFSGDGKVTAPITAYVKVGTLVATVAIADDAALGPRDILVRNPDGSTGTCARCFTVNPAPQVRVVLPSQLPADTKSQEITINGIGFTPGSVVWFLPAGVIVNRIKVVGTSTITANVTILKGALVGPREVRVQIPDGSIAKCSCFTVSGGPV